MKEIALTYEKFALVDDEDFEYLNQWKWFSVFRKGKMRITYYAARSAYNVLSKKQVRVSMHRLIMNTPKELEVDHIDGDGLNNQRFNLRNCTRLQNVLNQRTQQTETKTSKYRGVLWNGKRKWRVQIQYKGKVHYLGYFDVEEEAARAWDKKALELFGEFARLNFSEKEEACVNKRV